MSKGSSVPYAAFSDGGGDPFDGDGYNYHAGSAKMRQAQADVDEVVVVMKQNMEKVLERDARLDDLQDQSENLASGALRFKTKSTSLKRTMWWENAKWKIICVTILLIIIAIIIGVEVSKKKKD